MVLTAFNSEAVLDKNTGLVWEQSPQKAPVSWIDARFFCINKTVGGQRGFRLPSIPELGSLIDPSVTIAGPALPLGHPFLNVQSENFWSATTLANAPSFAWNMAIEIGLTGGFDKAELHHIWCVRGGMNADQY